MMIMDAPLSAGLMMRLLLAMIFLSENRVGIWQFVLLVLVVLVLGLCLSYRCCNTLWKGLILCMEGLSCDGSLKRGVEEGFCL